MGDIDEKFSRDQGFTLMEVLVAVAILAIGLVAVLKGSGENQDALIASRDMTVAGMLGQNLMARVGSTGLNEWTETSGAFDEPFAGYTWTFETETTDIEGMEKGMVTITVGEKEDPLLRLEEIFFREGG